ncbi:hypothetical protein AQJ84_15685 [Streptomyces resistomycificus]|uniref:Lipoprotein n=2 Tax=Streptomyces resistomycificus TaxID=67356 RepID=A0A0L8KRA4_9ACTN|nr:hypothetical protein ADK37_40005 [Streptomyces resistomycificus]KUN98136.1 hypothetical protein AQJ84_15685 [Streptomyces resistomycificus]
MLSTNGTRLRTFGAPTRATTGLTLSVVLSLALLSGCGGADADTAGKAPKASGSADATPAAAPSGPAYTGPALPGFAPKAAWSLPGEGHFRALDLGGTLLFAKRANGEYLSDNDPSTLVEPTRALFTYDTDEPEPLTLEFRDAKTGAVNKTLKVTAGSIERTTWHGGTPAIVVATASTTESDGLTEAKTSSTAVVYDAEGTKLGQVSGYEEGQILDGYRVETVDNTLRLTPVDGGTARTVTCTGTAADCTYRPEQGMADGFATHAPLIADTYYAGFENATNYESDPELVSLNDLATGKKVWSSGDAQVPPGVALDDEGAPASGAVRVLRVTDGKALVGWQSDIASGTWIDAWYDLASGKLTASYKASEEVLFSPDGSVAAKDAEEVDVNYSGTALWQVADGKRLWTQAEGETALDPLRFTRDGAVLYGLTDDGALAVDARTREVLAKDLPEESVPLVETATGYGYLSTGDGFFAFAPA